MAHATRVHRLWSQRPVNFHSSTPPRNAGIYRTQARERCYPLQSGQWALPTVLLGATTIAIDDSGVWRLLLAREMKRAGLDVDLNRAL